VRIGAYEIEGELGRGGMGVVFRARAPDGRPVALKLLSRPGPGSARDRFERERRLLAEFGEADGFVPLLDAGEERGQPFFVMPLLEGGTLRERLKKGALPVGETIELAEALALALSKAHAKGVVHRDLKPENVIFTGQGGEPGAAGRPFVADLGLAKHFDSDSPGASRSVALSKTGQLLGTVGYMAPEQARDSKQSGPAADVFALGAILYECLSGWPAFEGKTFYDVLAKVEKESPAPLANVRPETPVWLAGAIERALERDPAARYPDAGALLEAIRRRESGASRTGALRVRGRAARRALVAAPALLAVGLLAAALAQGPRGPDDRGRGPGGAPAAASAPPAPGAPESTSVSARVRLEAVAPPSSGDAPASLLAASSAEAAALRVLAARRAIAYARADAERLRSLFPDDRSAAVLAAIAALDGAGPGERARAEAALDAAPEYELARPLARAARIVDAVIEGTVLADNLVNRRNVPSLVEYLRSLATAPRESVDLAVAPLTEALVARALKLEKRERVSLKLADAMGLRDREAQARYFPPRLLRVCQVLINVEVSPSERARGFEEIAADASDPLVRAGALGEAIRTRFPRWQAGVPAEGEAMERDGVALAAVRAALEARGAAPAALPIGVGLGQRALAWERIAEGRGDRAAELARGIALAREALKVDETDATASSDLLRFLLEEDSRDMASIGALCATRPADGFTPEVAVLEIDARRMTGEAGLALADADAQLRAERFHPYVHAARALALADLGRLDEARAEAALVPGAGGPRPPLSKLAREAVARYVAEREAR
jgi:hypothetical protein